MLNAVIYARFSSDMQREESIDAQVRACKAYAKSKGYSVVKEYVDEAKSGRSTLTRDAYNQMMADAMENKFDVIIFHKIDRNSRNELNYFIFKDKLEKLGIRYEYAAQPIDAATAEGQMMETVMVGMAAYYSRNLAKETKKGMNENAYKAIFNGGYAPLGYKIVDKHYVIDEKEAEAVRLIFNLYLDGKGYGEICLALAARGYTTRSGKNFPKDSLHDILRNERYMGTYTFNRVPKTKRRNSHSYARPNDFISIPDAIPAIVSKETFLAAQEKMLLNKKRKGGAYTAKRDYLLSGKFFCGYCGSAMQGYSCCTRGNMYYYYSCARKDRVPADRCKQKMIRAEVIEHWIMSTLEREIFSDAGIQRVADSMSTAFGNANKEAKNATTVLLQRKAAAERKLDNLYQVIEDGDADEFNMQRLKKTKEELRNINNEICETAVKSAPDMPAGSWSHLIYVSGEQQAETEQDFLDIRGEMSDAGFIRKQGKKVLQRPSKPREFKTSGGFRVLVGRNNRQNDKLTLKDADYRDLWFHVQKLHGSHVILCTNGGEPGDQDITEAASLAAYYSQAKDSANVPVDCTQVKYVKKPAGARPGMVIYTTYRTVNVTPEEDLVKRLQAGK